MRVNSDPNVVLLLGATFFFLCLELTTADVLINKAGFQKGFQALAAHVPDLEILNEELPVVGMSINDLVSYEVGGGKVGSGIKNYLRQILFEQVMGQLNDNEVAGNCDYCQDRIIQRLNDILGIKTSTPCGPLITSGFGTQAQGSSGFNIKITDNDSGYIDEMDISFCMGFKKEVSVTSGGAFDLFEEALSIEAEGGAKITVNSYLKFSGGMKVYDASSFGVWKMHVEAGLSIDSAANLNVGLGMLDLQSNANVKMFGNYKLHICNTDWDSCDTSKKSLVNKDSSAAYKYYMTPHAAYKVEGGIGLAGDSGLQGLKMGTAATFKVHDSNVFHRDTKPKVTVTGLSWKDMSFFGPSNAVNLLRLIDSTLTRVQENEAVAGVNLPLVNKKLSDVLATGSIVTNKLNELFVKVEDYDDRAGKSLTRNGKKDFDFSSAESVDLDLILIRTDLNVNTENYSGLKELAKSNEENTQCSFSISSPSSTADLLSQMKKGMESCSLKVCDNFSSTKFQKDYVHIGRLRSGNGQICLDPEGTNAVNQWVYNANCGAISNIRQSDTIWKMEKETGEIHNIISGECLDIEGSDGTSNDGQTAKCMAQSDDMKWDIEYLKGDNTKFMLRNRANRDQCLSSYYGVGETAYTLSCDYTKEYFHWVWERPAGTENQCFKTKTGDYAFCDCDMVIGKDESNVPFIATTAFKDHKNSVKNDIRLLALMETGTPKKVHNHYGFEVNGASTPKFVPRFKNWEDLNALIKKSIQESLKVEGLTVDLKYVADVPARVELDIGFQYKVEKKATVDTSIEIGDLADISVDKGELSVGAGVNVGTSLAVLFAPDKVESLVATLQTPCPKFECSYLPRLNYKLEYQKAGSEVMTSEYGTLTKSSGDPTVGLNSGKLGAILSSVEKVGKSSIVLKFDPTVEKVKITPSGRTCLKKGTKDETVSASYTCPDGYSFKEMNSNAYGMKDISKKKTPFQITIGETALDANLDVGGEAALVSNIGGVIEATANVNAEFTGDMKLKVNPEDRGYVGFTAWLADIAAIKSETRQAGFFDAVAQFQGKITGSASASAPFDDLKASFSGNMETYSVDFMASNALANKPKFNVDVQLPKIGNIKDMSFDEFVKLLEKTLEFLVGDEEDKSEALKSCSGGLLGKEIAGEKIFQYPLPVIGISACKSAGHLQTFVTTVKNLAEEAKEGANSTFSALDNKLTTLLTDAVGGEPSVTITPSDNDKSSNLDVEIVLAYSYKQSEDLFIDLEDMLQSYSSGEANSEIVSAFANGFVDTDGSASIDFGAGLTVTLSIGLEYDKVYKSIKPYVRGSTGLEVTLFAETQFEFDAAIGPLKGAAKGDVKVGGGSTSPVKLSAGLKGDESTKHFITDSKSVTNLGNQVELSYGGSVSSELNAAMDDLFFPTGVPKIEGTVACSDLNKVIKGESGACIPNFKTSGPASLKMPSFFDLLLKDPQSLVDAVDDIFDRVEKASVGPDGLITKFPAPMIQKGIGDALGAGKEDNIIAEARKNVVQTFQERLDGYDKDKDGNAPGTMADVLAQELQRLLDNDSVDLIAPNKTVSVTCYKYDKAKQKQKELAKCSEGDPTSLMWTVPFGQEYTIELDLDFSLDAGSFPLALALKGESAPTLSISWEFTLGFGFDEKQGFFLSTEVQNVAAEERASELQVQAWFTLEDKTLDARLFFLTASMSDLDLHAAAGFFVDIVKPAKLDKAGPMKGRMSRSDLRKLNRASDLFQISAVAGATIQTQMKTQIDLGARFSEVAKYVPKLEGNIAIQARKEFTKGASRRLVSDFDRRRLTEIPSRSSHPATGLFRWLAEDEDEDDDKAKQILQTNFGSKWDSCPVSSTESLCAVMTDVKMDVKSIRDAIIPIAKTFVNDNKDGYLDKVVQPLLPLNEAIPGLSELTGDETSVLDLAEIHYPQSGASTVKSVIKMYEDISTFVDDLEDQGYIHLADKCDIVKGFECIGGGDEEATSRNLEEQEMPTIMLRGQMLRGRNTTNTTRSIEAYSRSLATSRTTDCSAIKSKVKRVACKANKVEGLSFPFLKNPKDALNLLKGEDLSLVEFTPPEITFGFYKEMDYMLYPLPTVTLGAYFEFSARFKYGLSLDTKGIREAITQSEPLKALNSFALMDKFDGVDEPLLSMTAAVGFEVGVSAIIAKVSVSGGIRVDAAVDLYDPYPEESNGLVRPYEMLSVSLNPIDWLEFSISMGIELAVSIQVGIFWWIFEFILYEYEKTWSIQLVAGTRNTPDQPTSIVECNDETHQMTLKDPGQLELACTGLEGEVGSEKIECVLDKPATDADPIQNCPKVSKVISASSSDGIKSLVLRDIKTHMDVNSFGSINTLKLDYASTTKVDDNLILIEGSKAAVGSSIVDFASATSGSLILPATEQSYLKTSFAGKCNTKWDLKGYTNLEVKAAQIDSNCHLTAPGGVGASDLVIDFSPPAKSSCTDGNHIIVTREKDDTLVTIVKAGETANAKIQVGKNFNNIAITMTDCKDTVDIFKTADSKGTVVVTTKMGDDTVTVGSNDAGVNKIYKKVVVHGGGGKGTDTLIVNDATSLQNKPNIELRSQSLSGLLNGAHGGKQAAKCSLDMFVGTKHQANDGKHCYQIKFGSDGYFRQDADNVCTPTGPFSSDFTVGNFKYQDTALNTAYYEKGSNCGEHGDRTGSISLKTDDSLKKPTISVTEPKTCVYKAVLTVPSSACTKLGQRKRSQLEFDHINDLQVKLNMYENVMHISSVPPGATTKIVGKSASNNKVYVDKKYSNLSLTGVTESTSGQGKA